MKRYPPLKENFEIKIFNFKKILEFKMEEFKFFLYKQFQ